MNNGEKKNKSSDSDKFIGLVVFSIIVLAYGLFNLFERVSSPILLLPFFLLSFYLWKKEK